MESLFASTFNLLLLIGILVFKLRKPIRDFVSQRHDLIRTEVETVHQRLSQAQEKYDEFTARLKAIDAEVGSLHEQTKNDIQQIKQRITTEARRMSSIVISDARNAAEGLYSELKGQLYSELGVKVLERAESLLQERLTQDDRVRIRKEFSSQMESVR